MEIKGFNFYKNLIFNGIKTVPFLLLIICGILFSNIDVYASDVNINSYVSATIQGTTGKYKGNEIYYTGLPSTYNIGTKYDGRLSYIEFYIDLVDGYQNIEPSTSYTLTLNMATDDWRNNFMGPQVYGVQDNGTVSTGNLATGFSFVSMKKVKLTFKTGSILYPHLKFVLYSTDISSTAITGVSNWNLSSIILSDPNVSSGGSGGGSSTPTPTPSNNTEAIIDNQNQNTQDIIDNQNQNTQDIIENNNQNTQQVVDSLNSNCKDGPLNLTYSDFGDDKGYGLNSTGGLSSSSNYAVSPYLMINRNTAYHINLPQGSYSGFYYCFYTTAKEVISCSKMDAIDLDITSPSNAYYMRLSLQKSRSTILTGPVCNDWEKEATNKVKDAMTDDSIDDKTGFFTNFNNDNHGLTGIITLPLSTIQSLANTSCVSLTIPIPFTNSNVSLPCMTEVYQTYIPSVYSIWQVVSLGIISYFICLDIFKMVKGFKDPNEDKIEVLDL